MHIDVAEALDGARIGEWRLRVSRAELNAGRLETLRVNAERSRSPGVAEVFRGVSSPGSRWRPPWLELVVTKPSPIGALELDAVFARLGRAIPPGAYVMIDLSDDPAALRAIAFGVPPVCTRQGTWLWLSGARWFKVWDFPEGGREGGEKLQGNVPLGASHARRNEAAIAREVRSFLATPLADAFPAAGSLGRALLARVSRSAAAT